MSKKQIKPQITPKSFDDYFKECIKNKNIPKDTPVYFKKAIEKVMKEYEKGIKLEKSSLDNFAEKYTIKGREGIKPFDFFKEKAEEIKDFLRNHRNIKVRIIMICVMEKIDLSPGVKPQERKEERLAYFSSKTHINIKGTDIKEILTKMIGRPLNNLSAYQSLGSGWYFKELLAVEIHTVKYKPLKGSSYIPLIDYLKNNNAIINIKIKIINVSCGVF